MNWVFVPDRYPPPEKPSAAAVLGGILNGAWALTAAALFRRTDLAPMLHLLYGRLQRTIRYFAHVAELVAQNRLPPPRPPRKRPEPPPKDTAEGTPDKPNQPAPPEAKQKSRLPGGFGWLRPLVPTVGSYGLQLEGLLADPEMLALIEAAPQLKRKLRWILRMLGRRPPPLLALPARPRKPRPRKPRPKKPRQPRLRRPRLAPEQLGRERTYIDEEGIEWPAYGPPVWWKKQKPA